MAMIYAPAPEVAEIAIGLIIEHHGNLDNAPILYVFMDPPPVSHGREVLGRARKVSGLMAFLVALAAGDVEPTSSEPVEEDHSFFVMEIAYRAWNESEDKFRAALVDHELCHFAVDDEGKLSIRAHDVEEFNVVVQRHGLWRRDVARFAASLPDPVSVEHS